MSWYFEGTHEMVTIKCQINLMPTWHENCLILNAAEKAKVEKTKIRPYVPMVKLSLWDILLQQAKRGFKW